MQCRTGCGACCTAPSISSALPGMPNGKPAGVVCVNLDPASRRCRIWGQENYPRVCRQFAPDPEVCGESRADALRLLQAWEIATA
jgi:hypothetical protein